MEMTQTTKNTARNKYYNGKYKSNHFFKIVFPYTITMYLCFFYEKTLFVYVILFSIIKTPKNKNL
jgi:hypothetical protein